MSYDITINQTNKQFGLIEGTIGKYNFYAHVQKEDVKDGISLVTMQKGHGKITKLCIYEDEVDNSGDPFLPTMSIKRHIYINFENDWKVYNFTFQRMVTDLIEYLDRRSSMTIIR
ncbi:MAG: hypothetical protein J7L15_06115 [Clostridiales bacterium]|nr:hypothetical protein [Clostridiales bacterium]